MFEVYLWILGEKKKLKFLFFSDFILEIFVGLNLWVMFVEGELMRKGVGGYREVFYGLIFVFFYSVDVRV